MGNACSALDIPSFLALNASSGASDALNSSLFHAFGARRTGVRLPVPRHARGALLRDEPRVPVLCTYIRSLQSPPSTPTCVSSPRRCTVQVHDDHGCYRCMIACKSGEGVSNLLCIPNSAGLGVRLAFYFQAALNACLVALSPEDSPGAAWGATLLTAAIVIPAIAQKKQGELTLYHATLVLDFTTLSSLASLAVAPLCPIWREKGLAEPLRQRYLDQKEQHADGAPDGSPLLGQRDESDLSLMPFPIGHESEEDDESDGDGDEDEPVPQHHAPNKSNVTYQRIVLSCALLAQVGLQWGYAVLLFTSPYFAEKSCSRSTVVVLFGARLKAADINQKYFSAWVLWLVFNMGVTFTWGAFLVLSGAASRRHPAPRASRLGRFLATVDPDGARRRQAVMWSALMVALFFVGAAEVQQVSNCFALSENNDWGFGQVAALLLVLVPIWQIVVVLNHRWFGRRERPAGEGARSRDERDEVRHDEERPGLLLAQPPAAVASALSFSPSSVTLRSRG